MGSILEKLSQYAVALSSLDPLCSYLNVPDEASLPLDRDRRLSNALIL